MAPGIRYTNFSSHTWPLTWMYPEDCVTSSRHRKTLELNNYKYRVLFEEAAEFATRFFNQNLQHPTRRVIRLYLLESRILFGKRRALRAEVPPLGYERVSRALDMLVDNAMYHIKMELFEEEVSPGPTLVWDTRADPEPATPTPVARVSEGSRVRSLSISSSTSRSAFAVSAPAVSPCPFASSPSSPDHFNGAGTAPASIDPATASAPMNHPTPTGSPTSTSPPGAPNGTQQPDNLAELMNFLNHAIATSSEKSSTARQKPVAESAIEPTPVARPRRAASEEAERRIRAITARRLTTPKASEPEPIEEEGGDLSGAASEHGDQTNLSNARIADDDVTSPRKPESESDTDWSAGTIVRKSVPDNTRATRTRSRSVDSLESGDDNDGSAEPSHEDRQNTASPSHTEKMNDTPRAVTPLSDSTSMRPSATPNDSRASSPNPIPNTPTPIRARNQRAESRRIKRETFVAAAASKSRITKKLPKAPTRKQPARGLTMTDAIDLNSDKQSAPPATSHISMSITSPNGNDNVDVNVRIKREDLNASEHRRSSTTTNPHTPAADRARTETATARNIKHEASSPAASVQRPPQHHASHPTRLSQPPTNQQPQSGGSMQDALYRDEGRDYRSPSTWREVLGSDQHIQFGDKPAPRARRLSELGTTVKKRTRDAAEERTPLPYERSPRKVRMLTYANAGIGRRDHVGNGDSLMMGTPLASSTPVAVHTAHPAETTGVGSERKANILDDEETPSKHGRPVKKSMAYRNAGVGRRETLLQGSAGRASTPIRPRRLSDLGSTVHEA